MSLKVDIAPRHPLSGDFAALDQRRPLPHEYFAKLASATASCT